MKRPAAPAANLKTRMWGEGTDQSLKAQGGQGTAISRQHVEGKGCRVPWCPAEL